MILVCGVADEPVVRWFLARLVAAGEDFHLLDERDLGERARLDIRVEGGRPRGRIDYGAWSVDLEEVTGVFSRAGVSEAGVSGDPAGKVALRVLLETFPGPVANRPSAMASNSSKPSQYEAIVRTGFDVPPTLCGGGVEALSAFRERNGPLVVKSTSSERSVVRELPLGEPVGPGPGATLPPHQFQARLRGTNVRVHTVGERVIACRMVTEALDYRYASSSGHSLRFEPARLATGVEDACRCLSSLLSLDFAGIDLLEDGSGRWYCFEVNTCPGYEWFERHAGVPVSAALVEHLQDRTAASGSRRPMPWRQHDRIGY